MMMLVALIGGWWADRSRHQHVINELRREISDLKQILDVSLNSQLEPDGDGIGDVEELWEMAEGFD